MASTGLYGLYWSTGPVLALSPCPVGQYWPFGTSRCQRCYRTQ